jgi:hypothetical protein
VLGEQEAVVGGEDQRGVAPQVVAVEIVEQLPEVVVAGRHERRVVGADLGDLLGRAPAALLVERPVEDAAAPAGRVLLLEARRRLERLVRIEALEHEEPRIGVAVQVEELEARREAARERQVLLVDHELAVDGVLDALPAAVVDVLRLAPRAVEVVVLRRVHRAQLLDGRLYHGLPRVVFLAADEVPRAEPVVIRGAAVLEVMQVVRDEVRMDAGEPERLRKRIVERLEGAPAAVHEVQAPGVQVAPRRHAGEAADEVTLERDAACREAIEIGRPHPGRPVAAERVAAQGIEQDEDRLHAPLLQRGD